MKLTTILLDLDGTLLPMDNDAFTKGYFKLLAAKLSPHGYEPKQLVDAIWTGTAAMVKNDGARSNEEVFWKKFADIYGEKMLADKMIFDEFYEKDFQAAKEFCGFNPKSSIAVHSLKEMGYRVALATNPIFPLVATESRIGWAGLEPQDFELAEVKLLVDLVQSSKFITTSKSRELIRKLEKEVSRYDAGKLHRQVVVAEIGRASCRERV